MLSQGKGGGIFIMQDFVLDQSLLPERKKEFYEAKNPAWVLVPAQNYIMISGKGNPNGIGKFI